MLRGFVKDPNRRASAADLLKDPWITAVEDKDHHLDESRMSEVLSHLK